MHVASFRSLVRLAPFGLAVILAACSSAGGASSSPSGPPSSGAPSGYPSSNPKPSAAGAALLIRVTAEGGFIAPSANLASLPLVTVEADGRIFTGGAVSAIYPGPLVPPVVVRDVGANGAERIAAAIHDAGLDKPGASTGPGNPDVGATVFTVIVDGLPVVSRFNGLGGGPAGPGVDDQGQRTAAALDLLSKLQDEGNSWGTPTVPDLPYAPTAYLIFVAPGAPISAEPSMNEPSVTWPLSTPLEQFGTPVVPDRGITGLRTAVVSGTDAGTLAPLLAGANQLTAFASAGHAYTLYVRPLLPDETP